MGYSLAFGGVDMSSVVAAFVVLLFGAVAFVLSFLVSAYSESLGLLVRIGGGLVIMVAMLLLLVLVPGMEEWAHLVPGFLR